MYFRGDLKALERSCVAIVGTRQNSAYGEYLTKELVAQLSFLKVTIVSGLALGIDTIAHQTALKYGLPTIAVLGSGLNKIYPEENTKLAKDIQKTGLIISEFDPNQQPRSYHFPQRNRIISGLSIATVVVEAPDRSGALITARYALEQGRDIFTFPGDIDRPLCRGPLTLIRDSKATCLTKPGDILTFLQAQASLFKNTGPSKGAIPKAAIPTTATEPQPTTELHLNSTEKAVLKTLTKTRPLTFEKLQNKTKLATSTLLSNLSILEIKNLITTKDGKYLKKC